TRPSGDTSRTAPNSSSPSVTNVWYPTSIVSRMTRSPSFSLQVVPLGASILDGLLALLGSIPTVNRENLAGDERGVVGTEPDDGARDLFRPADASDGMCGLQHLPYLRRSRKVAKHSRLDCAWSDGIDSNVLSGVFERDRFGQPRDGVFAGSVDWSRCKADQSCD